jgi:uncharacterized protein DUF6894
MPRYYFHVRDGNRIERDPEGVELADLDAARKRAVDRAFAIWSKTPPSPEHNEQTFEITDEAGTTVLSVPFSEAFAERAAT